MDTTLLKYVKKDEIITVSNVIDSAIQECIDNLEQDLSYSRRLDEKYESLNHEQFIFYNRLKDNGHYVSESNTIGFPTKYLVTWKDCDDFGDPEVKEQLNLLYEISTAKNLYRLASKCLEREIARLGSMHALVDSFKEERVLQ